MALVFNGLKLNFCIFVILTGEKHCSAQRQFCKTFTPFLTIWKTHNCPIECLYLEWQWNSCMTGHFWHKKSGFSLNPVIGYFIIYIFLKMGHPRPLFVCFHSLQRNFLHKKQWDSNSDRRSRRQGRWPLIHHHGSVFTFLQENW